MIRRPLYSPSSMRFGSAPVNQERIQPVSCRERCSSIGGGRTVRSPTAAPRMACRREQNCHEYSLQIRGALHELTEEAIDTHCTDSLPHTPPGERDDRRTGKHCTANFRQEFVEPYALVTSTRTQDWTTTAIQMNRRRHRTSDVCSGKLGQQIRWLPQQWSRSASPHLCN